MTLVSFDHMMIVEYNNFPQKVRCEIEIKNKTIKKCDIFYIVNGKKIKTTPTSVEQEMEILSVAKSVYENKENYNLKDINPEMLEVKDSAIEKPMCDKNDKIIERKINNKIIDEDLHRQRMLSIIKKEGKLSPHNYATKRLEKYTKNIKPYAELLEKMSNEGLIIKKRSGKGYVYLKLLLFNKV
jgi:hypothetical protein